ncbi:MAG: hypothetical protein ACOYYS_18980 [Chloroflexota bacterium]
MGKYQSVLVREGSGPKRPWKVHPVWRGIGLFMIIILAFVAYAAAVEFVDFNQNSRLIPLPEKLYQPIGYLSFKSADFGMSFGFQVGDTKWGVAIFTVLFYFMGLAIFSTIYAFIYRFIGPPRYIGYDVPPVGKYRDTGFKGKVGRKR